MDYLTKPNTRKGIRALSKVFRYIFDVGENEKFPVLDALEKLHDKFPNADWEVVPDDELPKNVPASCDFNDGNFLIRIKETVYKGAYENEIGGYRNHIVHEICHVFLYNIGYIPIMQRSFNNGIIKPYESVEWQAKALCGEVMMPYFATMNMTVDEIVSTYAVSEASARKRKSY